MAAVEDINVGTLHTDTSLRSLPIPASHRKIGLLRRFSSKHGPQNLASIPLADQIEPHVVQLRQIAVCTGSSAFYNTPVEAFAMQHTSSVLSS